jgi:hypothetical protein
MTTERCEKHGNHAGICWKCADENGRQPPWLADAAEALGEVRPEDGAPLALNWTQVIAAIRTTPSEHHHAGEHLRQPGRARGAGIGEPGAHRHRRDHRPAVLNLP